MSQKRIEKATDAAAAAGALPGAAVEMPLIASIRTGLAGGDDEALISRLSAGDYQGKSVQEVIAYLTDDAHIRPSDHELRHSIQREVGASRRVLVINGKPAKLEDRVDAYVTEKTHILPDQSQRPYLALDIEVSSVQQGGLYARL
jgi:hypothetical protein